MSRTRSRESSSKYSRSDLSKSVLTVSRPGGVPVDYRGKCILKKNTSIGKRGRGSEAWRSSENFRKSRWEPRESPPPPSAQKREIGQSKKKHLDGNDERGNVFQCFRRGAKTGKKPIASKPFIEATKTFQMVPKTPKIQSTAYDQASMMVPDLNTCK